MMHALVRNAELRRLWSRWIDVLDHVASSTRRAERMSMDRYRHLHTSLLQAIETSLERDCKSDQARGLLMRMQEECLPWITPDAFAQADRRLLMELADRARLMQRELVGHRPFVGPRLVSHLFIATAVGAVLAASYRWYVVSQQKGSSMTYELRGFGYRIWYALQAIEPLQWVAIIVSVVLFVGVWMMRTTKRY